MVMPRMVKSPRARRTGPNRVARRAGIAAVATAGVISVGFGAPVANAADADLQPTIDQLLAAMDQAVAADSSYANTTPMNNAMLPAAVQTLEFSNLNVLMNQNTTTPYWNQLPENISGPAVNSRQYIGANNPDNIYRNRTIDPNSTYVLTITPGPGTTDLNVTTGFLSLMAPSAGADLNISDMTPNADGTYTVIVSPTRPSDAVNWIDSTGANTVAIRNSLGDWAAPASTVSIENVGTSSPTPAVGGVTTTGLSAEAIDYLLTTLASSTPVSNYIWGNYYVNLIGRGPENGFTPIEGTTGEGSLSGQATSFGRYSLEPDQALVVTVPAVEAGYSGAEIAAAFSQTLGYASQQTSLNNTQLVPNADGSVTYVISATDPGVANWLDTTGVDAGDIVLRWQNVEGDVPTDPVVAQVVPVADVMDYLPEGTVTVTPAERQAALKQRLFSYDYAINSVKDNAWVTLNLQMDDLEAAMGTQNLEAVFGAEPDMPLLSRLTPEWSPDLAPLVRAVLTNPVGSLSAVLSALPQAVNDVQLPTVLATVRLAKVIAQTTENLTGAIESGDPGQALAAIAAGTQDVARVVYQTLTDPNTSITAGLLNARDDLALQVSRADSYSAPTVRSALSSLSDVVKVTATNAATTASILKEVGTQVDTAPVSEAAPATASSSAASEAPDTTDSASSTSAASDSPATTSAGSSTALSVRTTSSARQVESAKYTSANPTAAHRGRKVSSSGAGRSTGSHSTGGTGRRASAAAKGAAGGKD